MFRKTIFWIHLSCGVAAGLVILLMSVTGVLLAYERQILALTGPSVAAPAAREPLLLADLTAAVARSEPGFEPVSLTVSRDRNAPVVIGGAGRGSQRLVDPYTGAVLGNGESALSGFFRSVEGWHRWFNAGPDGRGSWRAVYGASNLLFLFLLVSGMYLWLPRVYRWAMFRARLFFVPLSTRGKARDFNWHHVLGIWCALPLIVIVASAAVFYYPWANALLYRSVGDSPPAPPARPGPGPAAEAGPADPGLSADVLVALASSEVGDWRTITVPARTTIGRPARITIDRGTGGQPQHRHTLTVDGGSGDVIAWEPFQSLGAGRRARSWVRFLHTGEAFGVLGQTVAALVSLAAVVMVWTGLALAWRRLVVPLVRRMA